MDIGIIALALTLTIMACIIRHLAIDPGFGIKTRAAGELAMWLAIGPRDVVYGDIDSLGKINDALTDPARGVTGHDRFNELMRWTLARFRRADIALVYGGDELRFLVWPGSGAGFARRLQSVLMAAPLTEAERARLLAATGRDHVTITLAVERSAGVCSHRAALNRAKVRVQAAKPKNAPGRRGEIVEATR
jgi:hypothetical protein